MYSCNYQKTVVPQCGFHFEELAKLFSQSELHRIGLQIPALVIAMILQN